MGEHYRSPSPPVLRGDCLFISHNETIFTYVHILKYFKLNKERKTKSRKGRQQGHSPREFSSGNQKGEQTKGSLFQTESPSPAGLCRAGLGTLEVLRNCVTSCVEVGYIRQLMPRVERRASEAEVWGSSCCQEPRLHTWYQKLDVDGSGATLRSWVLAALGGCEVWELRLSLPHSERKVIHGSTGRECQGARLEAERPSKWGCCPDSRCGLEDRQVLEQGAGEPWQQQGTKCGSWLHPWVAESQIYAHVADAAVGSSRGNLKITLRADWVLFCFVFQERK